MMTSQQLRLHADAGRELWIVRKVIRPGNKTFGTSNLPSLVCNVSFNSFYSLWQKMLAGSASFLQLSCLNQTVLLFFSYAAITYLNASLPQIIFHSPALNFREISP